MKIIIRDAFDREGPYETEVLVCENVSEQNGKRIVNLLNKAEHDNSPIYFVLVPDDHKLRIWEP